MNKLKEVKDRLRRVQNQQRKLDAAKADLLVAIADAHDSGEASYRDIGALLGVSRQRVHQMVSKLYEA